MKKLLALSTLVGAAGLLILGTATKKENKMGEEESNEEIVLTAKPSSSENELYSTSNKNRIKQQFLDSVELGDIWYTPHGKQVIGDLWCGHCGLVIGKDYSRGELFVVEANPKPETDDTGRELHGAGVCYGVVTVDRFIKERSFVLRVPGLDNDKRNKLVKFVTDQVWKGYPDTGGIPNWQWKKTPAEAYDAQDWYCSELVWSAYQSIGIQVEKDKSNVYGVDNIIESHVSVSPHEIYDAHNTVTILSYDNKHQTDLYRIQSEFKHIIVGDIIYESAGGIYMTDYKNVRSGHASIVKRNRYDVNLHQYVLDVIDVDITEGVTEHIYTADTFYEKEAQIIRVKGASYGTRNNAYNFCKNQIGKPYIKYYDSWSGWLFSNHGKNTSSSTESWYSSELVWAAYKNQNIDIEKGIWNLFTAESVIPVTAYEIFASDKTFPVLKWNEECVIQSQNNDTHSYTFKQSGEKYTESHEYSNYCSICGWSKGCGA